MNSRPATLGRPVSPAVMLSPNASYLVRAIEKPVRLTLNEHVVARDAASEAEQVTAVVPSGNAAPDAGLQAVWTAPLPPVTAGGSNVTGWVAPGTARMEISAGQAICIGVVGVIGPPALCPPHPTEPRRISSIEMFATRSIENRQHSTESPGTRASQTYPAERRRAPSLLHATTTVRIRRARRRGDRGRCLAGGRRRRLRVRATFERVASTNGVGSSSWPGASSSHAGRSPA